MQPRSQLTQGDWCRPGLGIAQIFILMTKITQGRTKITTDKLGNTMWAGKHGEWVPTVPGMLAGILGFLQGLPSTLGTSLKLPPRASMGPSLRTSTLGQWFNCMKRLDAKGWFRQWPQPQWLHRPPPAGCRRRGSGRASAVDEPAAWPYSCATRGLAQPAPPHTCSWCPWYPGCP